MDQDLVAPHGGKLVNLLAGTERAAELLVASRDWPSWDLSPNQLCDLELLLNGGFSPLEGFMTREDFEPVCSSMRLANGILWPMPICLDVPEELACKLGPGAMLALRDPEGVMLAALHVAEVWQPDRVEQFQMVYGTARCEHRTHPYCVGGHLEGIGLPSHYDFRPLRPTPAVLRAEFCRRGWRRVVAFHTMDLVHRVHQELTQRAMQAAHANLLLHAVDGMPKPGEIDHFTRVRCIHAILHRYPPESVKMALLPLAMRPGGARETLWRAIVAKNYGCSHFLAGLDHSTRELLAKHADELGVQMVQVPAGTPIPDPTTDTAVQRRLASGGGLPESLTFPEIARKLRRRFPPRHRTGFTVFFTGLSGAGKSTLARMLQARFLETGHRPVTLLDGDLVRKHLSAELGFSKAHRDTNVRRIGFVASEITKNGGIALCAPIAPYDALRKEVRAMIEPLGGFVLVYVATPLEVCESRDRKGLYAKARAGLIPEFTGISDPYQPPSDAELVLNTADITAEEALKQILVYLEREGYVSH